jgi:beta-glucosidase
MDASLKPKARAELLLAAMTLEEKVGQMTQAERGAVSGDPSLVTTWRLGSVLSGGGSTPARTCGPGRRRLRRPGRPQRAG